MRLGESFEERKIAVGPSAPPIMAMPAAWFGSKPNRRASMYAPKIPNCAAPPINNNLGFAIKAEKSVIAPIPKKISGGYQPSLTPE